ncbi:MAG: exodeoxyribonuclease VII large subunit [Bacteroidales bacterium]|nr:exodeoxyribonuclease VII large subunit [Bacteroidales bacterium]
MDCTDLLTLCSSLREGLESLFPEKLWVCAEVASIQHRANGHCYLDLVQSEDGIQKAKAKAIIWASKYGMLSAFYRDATGSDITAGQQILVRAQVNFSELYGLSLIIDDINPEYTLGDAELQRRKTVERLEEENLLGAQSRLDLCVLPYRLAVISARDAAGFGDFKRHLLENEYGFAFEVQLFEASMQGANAPGEIAAALELAASPSGNPYDAVLILRGGGSALDLACFDDYDLCKAIALCPIPVLTAIGHDKDCHVADIVAWKFVKTPTALADEFISLYEEADAYISRLEERLRMAFASKISAQDLRLGPLPLRIKQAYAGKVALGESKLDNLESRIALADPNALLRRGYTLVTDGRGVVLKRVGDMRRNDRISVRMSDGTALAVVESIDVKK